MWRSVTDDWSGGNGTTVISTPEAILLLLLLPSNVSLSLFWYILPFCLKHVFMLLLLLLLLRVLFQPAAASLHHRQSDHKSERQATFTEIATLRQHRQHRQQQQLTFRRLDAQHRPDLIYTFPNGPNRRQVPTIPPIMASINIWRYPSHL